MSTVKDLQTAYKEDIVPQLKEKLGKQNIMSIPKVTKITINAGLGSYLKAHSKDHESVANNLAAISGQKPVLTKAKKSVSNFKIREGDIIGASVTLRGKRMYSFINKLVNIVFPRVRDFRGISPKAFDGRGNYNVGFKEHTVFPEISPDDVIKLHGLQLCITTTAQNDEEGRALLEALGFPFQKPTKQ